MKTAVLTITAILLTASTSTVAAQIKNNISATAQGGDTKVEVKVDNKANTYSSSTSTTKNENTTKIDIDQSGEGTSSVTINGKEYKVEGEGSLHVDEKTTGTPVLLSTPSAQTPTPSPESDDKEETSESPIQKFFSELKSRLSKLFSNIF